MKLICFIVLLVQVISLVDSQSTAECNNEVLMTCGQAMANINPDPNADPASMCSAVDEAMGCVARTVQNCDEATRGNIETMMNNYAAAFEQPPYNCHISNADAQNATPRSPCEAAMDHCNTINYQLPYIQTMTEACGIFDAFILCMRTNTSVCGPEANIDAIINNATASMDQDPFHCYERGQYNIAFCEENFKACMDPLTALFMSQESIAPDASVCGRLRNTLYCVQANLTTCSPRLDHQFRETVTNFTYMFQSNPFNCSAEEFIITTPPIPTVPPTTPSTTTTTTTKTPAPTPPPHSTSHATMAAPVPPRKLDDHTTNGAPESPGETTGHDKMAPNTELKTAENQNSLGELGQHSHQSADGAAMPARVSLATFLTVTMVTTALLT